MNFLKIETHELLEKIHSEIYSRINFKLTDLTFEEESAEYNACKFYLNNLKIISRDSKITPKKIGQFVTFWKRRKNGEIEPFHLNDIFDHLIINCRKEDLVGQFVFPKAALVQNGIISTKNKDGKRAFRLYPSWDSPKSKQAIQSQNWQLKYFFMIDDKIDLLKLQKSFEV